MKSSNQHGFAALVLALVTIIVLLLGAVGYFVYDRNRPVAKESTPANSQTGKTANTSTAEIDNKELPKQTAVELTDDQKIRVAAGCEKDDSSCKIVNRNDKAAQLTVGNGEGAGGNVFVVIEDGEWKSIWKGNGEMPLETQEKYPIPTKWLYPDNPIDGTSQ